MFIPGAQGLGAKLFGGIGKGFGKIGAKLGFKGFKGFGKGGFKSWFKNKAGSHFGKDMFSKPQSWKGWFGKGHQMYGKMNDIRSNIPGFGGGGGYGTGGWGMGGMQSPGWGNFGGGGFGGVGTPPYFPGGRNGMMMNMTGMPSQRSSLGGFSPQAQYHTAEQGKALAQQVFSLQQRSKMVNWEKSRVKLEAWE